MVHVLMDCCLQEKTYNPFYAFLASKLCGYERRFQVTGPPAGRSPRRAALSGHPVISAHPQAHPQWASRVTPQGERLGQPKPWPPGHLSGPR